MLVIAFADCLFGWWIVGIYLLVVIWCFVISWFECDLNFVCCVLFDAFVDLVWLVILG